MHLMPVIYVRVLKWSMSMECYFDSYSRFHTEHGMSISLFLALGSCLYVASAYHPYIRRMHPVVTRLLSPSTPSELCHNTSRTWHVSRHFFFFHTGHKALYSYGRTKRCFQPPRIPPQNKTKLVWDQIKNSYSKLATFVTRECVRERNNRKGEYR